VTIAGQEYPISTRRLRYRLTGWHPIERKWVFTIYHGEEAPDPVDDR
jgi:hypothetical protein